MVNQKERESQKYTERHTIRHNIDHIYDRNSVMKWANKQSNNSFNRYIVHVIYMQILLAYIHKIISLNKIK